jgi:hypothetical protein
LIELERELGAMLLDFQWKYNTPDVRWNQITCRCYLW